MELENSTSTKVQQDRPTTRWRREERPITRTKVIDDPLINPDPDQIGLGVVDKGVTLTRERPASRRGIMSRQTAMSLEERPYTQQSLMRPMTASRPLGTGARPPSASAFSRNAVPRTASRLASQANPTRLGSAMSIPSGGLGLGSMERPITQQGLSGLKTSGKGPPMRQVQDKRYFEGLLQIKMRELSEEIARLSRDIDSQSREQSTFLVYDTRVKEMAAELTDLQGSLADYNLVVDKLNTDTAKGDVDAECHELKSHNDHVSSQLEQLFAEQKQKEAEIRQLETEIDQERHMTDNLLAAMSPTLKEHHAHVQRTNSQLQHEMESLQQRLDALTSKKTFLNNQLAVSQIKREAVQLFLKLHEAEDRRDALVREEKTRATPAQEREELLQKVKDDNAEMATMERQAAELRDETRRKREELELVEQDLDESQSERHQKFRELRRREETMEQFLATFEEKRDQETARIARMEEDVVAALRETSRNLGRARHVPSVDDYSQMKDSLAYKEGELEKSKKTVGNLSKEQLQLKANLQKVEDLEEKIKGEMVTLRERMVKMTEEMVTLSDLDALREQAKVKHVDLEREQIVLLEQQQPTKELLEDVQAKHSLLKKQLNDNETHAQLTNLERKLAQLEQNNFTVQEFVASKKTETEFEPTKVKVFELVKGYNVSLKENLRSGAVV